MVLKVKKVGLKKKTSRVCQYKCQLCDNVATLYKDATVHMETSHKRHWFTCNICKWKFSKEHSMYKHKRRHLKTFACSVCNKTFTWESELNEHKWVHNKKLKIRCPLCTWSFMRVGSMNQHAKTHMNQNKFKCDCCNFKTSTEHNLKQHVTGQHGWGIKAPCGFCLKWWSQLKWHQKKCEKSKSLMWFL